MKNFIHKIEGRTLDSVLGGIEQRVEKPDIQKTFVEFLRMVNVEGDFEHLKDREFKNDREKLNSKPGLLLANHPGLVDVPLILQVLNRKDLLIMANPRLVDYFQKYGGKDSFVAADTEPGKIQATLQKSAKHITDGGLFVIFPTGGDERKTGQIVFKRFFRHLLKKIPQDSMVYSFFVNPSDIENAEKLSDGRLAGLLSDISTSGKVNITRLVKTARVRIKEAYSEASEWQKLIKNNGKNSDEVLTNHFLEKFKPEGGENNAV